jgi:hypothetical protein
VIAALLTLIIPLDAVVDRVDIAEINHVIDPETGNETAVYWVWWRWERHGTSEGYYVADWRLYAEVPQPTKGIQQWYDKKSRCLRWVESRLTVESWLYYDVEVENRKLLPESKRRRLSDPKRGRPAAKKNPRTDGQD